MGGGALPGAVGTDPGTLLLGKESREEEGMPSRAGKGTRRGEQIYIRWEWLQNAHVLLWD